MTRLRIRKIILAAGGTLAAAAALVTLAVSSLWALLGATAPVFIVVCPLSFVFIFGASSFSSSLLLLLFLSASGLRLRTRLPRCRVTTASDEEVEVARAELTEETSIAIPPSTMHGAAGNLAEV